ncbi:MAG: type VI secretion system protein, partial [Pirellula sp.]|nr:type VI secretion system protein [Pirellula sp.]
MSDDFQSISNKIASWFRISFAGWMAVAAGAVLFIVAGIVGLTFHTKTERIAWSEFLSWNQIGLLISLLLISCVSTYWLVRIALSSLPATHQELEAAWHEGLDAIARRGLSLSNIPVFLVMGAERHECQRNFLKQLGMNTVIPACPETPDAPIRWFSSDDKIAICCDSIGMFTLAQSRLELHRQRLQQEMPFSSGCAVSSVDPTDLFEHPSVVKPRELNSSDEYDEMGHASESAMVVDGPAIVPFPSIRVDEATSSEAEACEPTFSEFLDRVDTTASSYASETSTKSVGSKSISAAGREDPRLFDELVRAEELVSLAQQDERVIHSRYEPQESTDPLTSGPVVPNVSILSSPEVVRVQTSLHELCGLLTNARGDTAPINGIVVRVDVKGLMQCRQLVNQTGQALRRDLELLQSDLGIQVPMAVVLDNLQEVDSFRQLIRRLGAKRASGIALGEIFDIRRRTTTSNICIACSRLMHTLQRAVVHVLKTEDGLIRPMNHKVFPFLTMCRGGLSRSTRDFLVEALSTTESNENAEEGVLLQGIYAMGSGNSATHEGFGRPILRNLVHECETLSWTAKRLNRESIYIRRVQILQSLCIVLAVSAFVL